MSFINKKKFLDIKIGYSYYLCQTIECKSCGLVFLDQRFTKKELDKYYNEFIDNYAKEILSRMSL